MTRVFFAPSICVIGQSHVDIVFQRNIALGLATWQASKYIHGLTD